jgi:integrase
MVLSPEQARRVVAGMGDGQLGRLVVVALHSGVRLGELLGLRWDDVTLDGATPELRVAQTVQWRPGEHVAVEPKSRRSRRTVPLTREAVAALNAEHQAQLQARLAAGPRWKPVPGLGELAFTTSTGRPLSGPHVTRRFQRALAAAGLPRLRFHDLRAASGALLLSAGVDIAVVSRRLGHSGIGVTASRYAGVADQLQRDASERLQALLEDGR